jgi:hypothetical protein
MATTTGKLRESEARDLVLSIAAKFPNHRASTTEIKDEVPKYRNLSAADLQPSKTRANEHMWEQIVGNVTGSHKDTSVSIFNRDLAQRTDDGVQVTEKGLKYLKDKGL